MEAIIFAQLGKSYADYDTSWRTQISGCDCSDMRRGQLSGKKRPHRKASSHIENECPKWCIRKYKRTNQWGFRTWKSRQQGHLNVTAPA
eukprot:7205544-Ditylum_brightwellii.AAC.1